MAQVLIPKACAQLIVLCGYDSCSNDVKNILSLLVMKGPTFPHK